jgi:hypothetical protein
MEGWGRGRRNAQRNHRVRSFSGTEEYMLAKIKNIKHNYGSTEIRINKENAKD